MGDILFIAHRIPWPPDRGDRIRSYHMLKALAATRRVHLAGFVDEGDDPADLGDLDPLVADRHIEVRGLSRLKAGLRALASGKPVSLEAFASATMQAAIDAIIARHPIDAIVVYSGQMAQYVPTDARKARFVMDFVDVDSAKFASYGAESRGPMGWVHRREGRLLAAFEDQVAHDADVSLFVSEAEAALFRSRTGLAPDRVRAVENGIDTAFFDPEAAFHPLKLDRDSPLLVFTGQMDYRPNIEAVTHFATQIFPAIRRRDKRARFTIVGRSPTPAVLRLGSEDGVIVTGSVPDVRPWLAAADVVVAPLQIARGIQNKVLEAMAMARPVVASSAAFEGIDATPDKELLVADGGAMVASIGRLLADPQAARAMGQAARARMLERYGWEARLAPLQAIVGGGQG